MFPLRSAQVLSFKRADFVLKILEGLFVNTRSLIAPVNRQVGFLLTPKIEIHCYQAVIPGGRARAIDHHANQKGEKK